MKQEKGLTALKITKRGAFVISIIMVIALAGCSRQFEKLEDNQAQLKLMAQTNSEQIAAIAGYIHQNQNELTAKIQQVRNETKVVADNVSTLSDEQLKLHQTSQNNVSRLANQLSLVSDNQDALSAGLAASRSENAKIGDNVTTLDRKQTELYNAVQANNSKLTERVSVLEQGQNNLMTAIDDSKSQTLKVTSEIASLGNQQAKFHETSQNSIQQIADNMTRVIQNQKALDTGLALSRNETSRVSSSVTALDRKQAEMFEKVQNSSSKLAERVATLEKGQNNLMAGIEDSKNQTLKVSSEVASLGNQQAKFHETSQNSIQQIVDNLTQVTQNQQTLNAGLFMSRFETAKVADNLAILGQEQQKLQGRLQDDTAQMANYLSEIVRNQSLFKTGFEEAHNETDKVGNNVASLGQMQKELSEIIQNNNSSLSARVAAIEKSQSDLQTGIESVQNETKKVAENISAVGDSQTNLQETVENYNQQLTERVVVVEQSQEEWQTTINQMQASIKEVAGNINTFEQNLTKLHEIFQSNMGELTTVANTNSQVQLHFQEKIKNDLLALTESVNAIKQSQSQLQKKIEDVQSNTESITIEFPAAIEQLRKEMTIQEEEEYSSDQ